MTTYTTTLYTIPQANNGFTDADCQLWVTKAHEALAGAGLIQTADTGQVDPGTVTNASMGTTPGTMPFSLWRFNDSQQGTHPLFIRFHWGRQGNGNPRAVWISLGTGTDGSGNLTGEFLAAFILNTSFSTSSGTASVYDAACHRDGYFRFFTQAYFVNQYYGHCAGQFAIERTRDGTGAYDGRGVAIYHPNTSSQGLVRAARYDATYSSFTTYYCIPVGNPSDTADANGDKRCYPFFALFPDVFQFWSMCTIRENEVGLGPVTFSAKPHANVAASTFQSFGTNSTFTTLLSEPTQAGQWVPAWIWE